MSVNVVLNVAPAAVLAQLGTAGIRVVGVFEHLGLVSGTIAKDGLVRLSRIPGGSAVEPDRAISALIP